MAAPANGTFNYTYGAGSQHNRQVQFSRTGAGSGTIQAQVFVLNPNGIGNFISTVPGGQINVEMESTTTKANAVALGRVLNPDRTLSALDLDQQDAIIGSLIPIGTRSIEFTNDIGGPGGLEQVVSLNIYDPS